MKVNGFDRNDISYPHGKNQSKQANNAFQDIFDKNTKNEQHMNIGTRKPPVASLQINKASLPPPSLIDTANFKHFLKTAVNSADIDLKNEINHICSDETGENIDTCLLEQLMDLYIENKKF